VLGMTELEAAAETRPGTPGAGLSSTVVTELDASVLR